MKLFAPAPRWFSERDCELRVVIEYGAGRSPAHAQGWHVVRARFAYYVASHRRTPTRCRQTVPARQNVPVRQNVTLTGHTYGRERVRRRARATCETNRWLLHRRNTERHRRTTHMNDKPVKAGRPDTLGAYGRLTLLNVRGSFGYARFLNVCSTTGAVYCSRRLVF